MKGNVKKMSSKHLVDDLKSKYGKIFWLKNYVKTVSASTLIGSGIGLVVTGELTRMQNCGISNAEIILGITCVILAFLITFALDLWLKKKEEEKIRDVEDYIDERASEIAEDLVIKHLEEIGKSSLKED